MPPPLVDGPLPQSPEAALDVFLAWVQKQGLELYPAQEEALLELSAGKHVVLNTPTGSGKSLVAVFAHYLGLVKGQTSAYTCPIKALVNEKFFQLCEVFGAERVGMMTGDAAINRDAPILCCTAEILANRCLREDRIVADVVVMDEFHYYGDKDRGVAWQVPLLAMKETQFLLMSATLGHLENILQPLAELTQREVAQVRGAVRPVPLEFHYAGETPLHETVQTLLKRNQAPIYLVNFSQRAAAEQAQNLLSIDFASKEQKEALKSATQGFRFDTPFGKDLRRFILHGVGLHHAGLLPRYRRLVERLAQEGRLLVISGTDTLGVGVNVPIRSVLFTQLCKYDGQKTAVLTVRDFLQISGRAGRKGFDTQGTVVAQAPEWVLENQKLQQKKDAGKKVVLQKPPTKGYAHWDKATFEQLQTKPPEPLEPRFEVSHGLLLNLLQSARDSREGGYRKLVTLVGRAHLTAVGRVKLLKRARTLIRALIDAGLVVHEKRSGSMPAQLAMAEGLQRDFSLFHTLSLYLLETLPKLDKATESYHLDVLTLVESILENPDAVLFAQLDKAKGLKVQELKAQGMEYDQRMEELEKVEYPKPNKDFIYGTFDAFAAKHPWVGHENIRPKSIARELFETQATFNEYVREYGLGRSEGVLLRYLSEAYKTLAQNVPESARTEGVEDVLSFLFTTLKQVDSSLLEEWEALRDGTAFVPKAQAEEAPRKKDLAANQKQLVARARSELHRLVALLSRKRWEDAAESLGEGSGWDAKSMEAELQPFLAEHPALDATPKSRTAEWTRVDQEAPRRWAFKQTLHDAEGPTAWWLEGVVDLEGKLDVDGALVALRGVKK